MRELTRSLKPRIEEKRGCLCRTGDLISVHMQGNKSRIHPGTRTPTCAAKYESVYLYSSPKVYELLRFVFFVRGEGGNRKQCHSHPSLQASSLLSSRRATPPAVGQGADTNCTNPPQKSDFLSSERSVNLGDKATIKRTSVGLKCAQKCARQSVRGAGGAKLVRCHIAERGAIMRSRLRSV